MVKLDLPYQLRLSSLILYLSLPLSHLSVKSMLHVQKLKEIIEEFILFVRLSLAPG